MEFKPRFCWMCALAEHVARRAKKARVATGGTAQDQMKTQKETPPARVFDAH
jgi:hypothetical protein